MPRVIRARDVDAVLAAHPHSEWTGDDWLPGCRVAQDGRRRVLVYHDGPGEEDGLEQYRLELQAAGYCVVPDRMEGGHRSRLHVTRP